MTLRKLAINMEVKMYNNYKPEERKCQRVSNNASNTIESRTAAAKA